MPAGGPVEFVSLTGHAAARLAAGEVSFVPDKRFQLLAYVAYAGGPVGRERAAFLFWPDSGTATSRQNLRGLLQRLHTLPFTPGLEVTNHYLRWDVPTDVAAFEAAAARGDLSSALAAYGGPLLQGLDGDEDGEFAEWLEIEREHLHARWRDLALRRLSELSPEDAAEAPDLLRRLLESDSLDEEAVRVYLQAMARLGQPAAAERAFRDLAARLQREMGLEPTSETVAAYLAAKASRPAAATRPPVAVALPPQGTAGSLVDVDPALAFHRPPAPSTSFVGRRQEMADVGALLRDPTCRLVSLLGPGGVGKTRLALAVAQASAGDFDHGAAFVPLDGLTSAEEVMPAIAAALGLGHVSAGDLEKQAGRLLSDRSVLLVIDNFEHVLPAAAVLPRLLAAAAGLKLLVTTRERLALEAEWTYPVDGLDFPGDDVPLEDMSSYGAAELLLARARRVRPAFELTAEDLPALRRLFALTRGLPLAIELVAGWLRAAPLTTLVEELEQDPGALGRTTTDAPPRHGSIWAVMGQSWSRLAEVERVVLRRLGVFAGSVTAEAAAFVAGANRAVLGALVDRSLLRLRETGRYDRHPLLLAYSRERLAEHPEEVRDVEGRHASYYLRFLRERSDRARGPRPALVLREVHAEARELRASMRRAAERGDGSELVAFLRLLELEIGYFLAHGHDDETLALLDRAATAAASAGDLETGHDLRGRVGDVYAIQRRAVERALPEYRKAAELARRSGNRAREAVFVGLGGVFLRAQGEAGGEADLERALELARSSEDPVALSTVLEHRAYAHAMTGDLQGAHARYREALEVVEGLEDRGTTHPYELARRRYYATVNLGEVSRQLGMYEAALEARSDALRIAREMGNQMWEAHVHLELAEMLGERAAHAEAHEHLRLAHSLYLANHVTAHLGRIADLAEKHGYELGR